MKWIVDVLTQGKGRKTKKIIGKLKLSFGWRHGKKKTHTKNIPKNNPILINQTQGIDRHSRGLIDNTFH